MFLLGDLATINSVFQLYLIQKILQNIFSTWSTLSNSLDLWNIDALLSYILLFITRYLVHNDRISFLHLSLWAASAVYGSLHKTYRCPPFFPFYNSIFFGMSFVSWHIWLTMKLWWIIGQYSKTDAR